MTTCQTEMTQPPYFTQKHVLGVVAVPASVFLANGMLVLMLKLTGAGLLAYGLAVPLVLAAGAAMVRHLRRHAALPDGRRLLVLLAFASAASAAHLIIFGTAINSDATVHSAHAFHTVFSAGGFSFSEAPFVTYGTQPPAKHWLPNNLEYATAAIAWIFDLSFYRLTLGVNFVFNLLYVAVFLALIFTFVRVVPGLLLATAFLAALYAVIGNSEDIIGMGLFRGFENKGLIFGFYYWGTIALFLVSPGRPAAAAGPPVAVIVFATSAVVVSANFPVLAVIALVLAAGAVAGKSPADGVGGALRLVTPIILAAAIYAGLPGGDVLTPPGDPASVTGAAYINQISDIYTYPKKHWIAAAAVVVWLFWFDRALAVQLAVYLAVALVSHTSWAFELAAPLLGGYSRVVWRFLILFNPFVPIIVGGAALAGRLDRRRPARLPTLALVLVAGGLILRPPPAHPYVGAIRPVLPHVAAACRPDASILVSRALGAVLPVIAPGFRIYAGKDQYLNWQIANLAPGSPDRKRAEDVRDASSYLGGNAANEAALAAVVAAERPEIVIADAPLSSSAEQMLADYRRETYRAASPYVRGKTETHVIYSLPGVCAFPE